MKFGFSFIPDEHFRQVIKVVKFGEKIGFDYAWLADQSFHRDVYIILTTCSLKTKKISLGVGVTNPYTRHPIITAKSIGTINEVSGNRAILGFGLGNPKELLSPLGFNLQLAAERCKEAIEIVRELLKGKEVNYRGKFFQLNRVKICFKAQENIPIYVAATVGSKMLRLAGEVGDGVIVGGLAAPYAVKYALTHVKKGADLVTKDFRGVKVMSWIPCRITHKKKAFLDKLRYTTARFIGQTSLKGLREIGIDEKSLMTIRQAYKKKGLREACKYTTDNLVDSFSIVGTPTECIAKIEALEHVGVKHLTVAYIGESWRERLKNLKFFAKKIIPNLR